MPKTTLPTLKLRLTLDVTYQNADGDDVAELKEHLEGAVESAVCRGLLLPDNSPLTVRAWGAEAVAVESSEEDLPDEDVITQFVAHQIKDGQFDLEDMPRRAARYGLMSPVDFQIEMRERIELVGDEAHEAKET